jgi:hypothetical protein
MDSSGGRLQSESEGQRMCTDKVIRSARTVQELDEIRWWLDDPWFTENDITMCSVSRTLRIGFWLPDIGAAILLREGLLWWVWRRYRVPMRRTHLEILHVESFSVEDLHRMGMWIFDGITFDEHTRRLVVTGVPPVEVTANVRILEVLITAEECPSGSMIVALDPYRANTKHPSEVLRD